MANGSLPVNSTIGHYRILSRLGAGGMGEVWLAKDTILDRNVALKLLPAEFTNDPDRARRFEQEAKAASALNHPHIITIHEIGEADAGRFIVMELVQGQTLRSLSKPCPLDTLVSLGGQIAKALSASHAAGITHRDIKPENIMVRDDGYVKILDFGLARLIPGTATDPEAATLAFQTMPGKLLGTVAYMSPEQARGELVTPATDVFALGIVFFELATGEHPFKADTMIGMLHSITAQTPVMPSRMNPDLPAALEDLILRMLEKEAGKRPSAVEVDQALAELAGQRRSGQPQRRGAEDKLKLELPSPSIAVLPFVNMSADPENEYFCNGLAEELLNALSKIEALHVAARTSAFSFKGKQTDISEIGEKLKVKTVLEGSVRKSGNRLRITAQLINVADGYHLWSERYDRELQDVFDIQDEISLAIVDALKVKLMGTEKAAVLKRYTEKNEAYQLYLKGRYQFGKYREEGWRKALEYFAQAIEKEPNYALAWAGLANSYRTLWYNGYLTPEESVPKWKAAITRALAIDSTLAEPHVSLALLKHFYEWDFPAAEREYKRAIELNPKHAEIHERYGLFLAVLDRADEAMAEGQRALELDPLSLVTNLNVGWLYWTIGQFDRMREQGRKLIELEPNFYGGHWQIGAEFWTRGRYEEGTAEIEKAVALEGGSTQVLSMMGCLYGVTGRRSEAQQVLNQLLELDRRGYSVRFYIANVYAGLGETDRVFEWFEKAYQQREGIMVFLKPFARSLYPAFKSDPRLADLVRRIGLPQ